MYRFETTLEHFSSVKPVCITAHPKRPWLASATENGIIKIWDYQTNQYVHQYSLVDLESLEKNSQALQAIAEKDPHYKGPRKPEVKVSKKAIGPIKVLKFVDQDIRFMKYQQEKGTAEMSSANEEKLMAAFAAEWPHLLIACGENRIFYLDYVSYSIKEIDMALFDGKMITCIEPFALEDLVAFGCSDGVVRIWNVFSGSLTKLNTSSSKPIAGMYSYYNDGGSFLTAVTIDGLFTKWKMAQEPIVEMKDSKGSFDVYDMSFNPLEHHLVLLTDKGIVIRDYYYNKEIERIKIPSSKQSFVSLQCFVHPKYPPSSVLLLNKDSKTISYFNKQAATNSKEASKKDDEDQSIQTIINVADLPKHDKDKTKITLFSLHPTNPSILFLGTSTSLAIIKVDPLSTPNFALVPVSTQVLEKTYNDYIQMNNKQSGSNVGGRTSVSAGTPFYSIGGLNSKIYYVSESQIRSISSADPLEKGSALSFPSLFAQLSSDDVKISVNPTHSYLAAFYLKEFKYDIYSLNTRRILESDSNIINFAWSTSTENADTFVVLSGPIAPPKDDGKKKKDASANPTRTLNLNVRQVGKTNVETIKKFEATWTCTPSLFSGPLIGIDIKVEPKSILQASTAVAGTPMLGSASNSLSGSNLNLSRPITSNTLQFYSWKGDPVGIPMPSPLDICWDVDTVKYCLFVYESYFCVFATKPKFKLLAKVSDVVLSSLWFNGCLFYTTRTDIKCFFVHQYDCREVVISGVPTDAFSSALLSAQQQFQETLGGCSLVEVANDKLVLITSDYRIVTVFLDNPIYQFYVLAHAGRVAAAVQVASNVSEVHHPLLATFLEARGHVKQIKNMQLPDHYKLQLYIKHGLFEEASEVVISMIHQFSQKHQYDDDGEIQDDDALRSANNAETTRERNALLWSAQRLIAAATQESKLEVIAAIWTELAPIEPTAYRHLALFYAQNGMVEQLRELYKRLNEEANRSSAIKEELKYVAIHISPSLLTSALQAASNSFAEYIVSLHASPEKEAELLEMWNARLSTGSHSETLRGVRMISVNESKKSQQQADKSRSKSPLPFAW